MLKTVVVALFLLSEMTKPIGAGGAAEETLSINSIHGILQLWTMLWVGYGSYHSEGSLCALCFEFLPYLMNCKLSDHHASV